MKMNRHRYRRHVVHYDSYPITFVSLDAGARRMAIDVKPTLVDPVWTDEALGNVEGVFFERGATGAGLECSHRDS